MKWISGTLVQLQRQWMVGFAVALVIGLALLMFGAIAAAVVSGITWLAGVPDAWPGWLMASAMIWGPLAVGLVAPSVNGLVKASKQAEAERSSPYA